MKKPVRLAVAGLLLLSLLTFADFFLFGKVPVDPARGADVARHVYPLKVSAVQWLQKGSLPLWNPYLLSGTPWLGDGQTFLFDPFNVFLLIRPSLEGYVWTLWFLFLASLLAGFALLRTLRFSEGASFLGAVVYGLNGFTMTYMTFQNAVGLLVWLPLILSCLERGSDEKRPGFFFLGGLCFGFSLLSLTPTYLSGMGMTLGLFVMARTWEKRRKGWFGTSAPLTGGMVIFLTGLLIGAVELLPMVELSGKSQRALSAGTGYFSKNYLPWLSLVGLVFPLTGQELRWTGTAVPSIFYLYIGMGGLVLVLFGFGPVWKDRKLRFFGRLGVFALGLLLLLRFPFLRRLWHLLPVLKELNLFKFLLAFYPLCAAVWTAAGYADWSAAKRPSPFMAFWMRGLVIFHLAVLTTLVLYGALSSFFEPMLKENLFPVLASRLVGHGVHPFSQEFYEAKLLFLYGFLKSPSFLGAVVGLGVLRLFSLLALEKRWALKRGTAAALMVLFPLELAGTWRIQMPFSAETAALYRKTNEISLLESRLKPEERAVVLESRDWSVVPQALASFKMDELSFEAAREAYREDESHHQKRTLLSNILLTFRIPDAGGKQSLFPGRTLRYLDALPQKIEWRQGERHLLRHEVRFQGEPDARPLDLLGLKYVLSRYPLKSKKFRLLMDQSESERRYFLYENRDAFPRAFLVPESEMLQKDEEILARLQDRSFNPRRTLLLEEEPSVLNGGSKRSLPGEGSATITLYAPDRVEIEAVSPGPAHLLLTDPYYPGWRAFVDGRETKVLRADFLFRSVALPPGSHRIVFRYEPKRVKIGTGISGLTLLGLCGGGVWSSWTKKHSGKKGAK